MELIRKIVPLENVLLVFINDEGNELVIDLDEFMVVGVPLNDDESEMDYLRTEIVEEPKCVGEFLSLIN